MMRPTLSTLSIPIIGGVNSGQQKNITSKEGKETVKNLSHADPHRAPRNAVFVCG